MISNQEFSKKSRKFSKNSLEKSKKIMPHDHDPKKLKSMLSDSNLKPKTIINNAGILNITKSITISYVSCWK